MTFGFRLRVNLSSAHALIAEGDEVAVPGILVAHHLRLLAVGCDSISNAERLAFRAGGFETEGEARKAAHDLREGLAIAFATHGVGVDLGKDQVGMRFSTSVHSAIEQAAEKSTGEKAQVLPDVHGVLVFEEHSKPVFLGGSGRGVVGRNASAVLETLREVVTVASAIQPSLRLAIEVFNSSPFESTPRARFLSLITCIEVLAVRAPRDSESLAVIDKIVASIEESKLGIEESQKLRAGVEGLRRESIRSACDRLVSAHGTGGDLGTWSRAYSLRHRLVHAGVESYQLQELLSQLEQVVRRVLLSSVAAA